ncbi:MAG: UDP-glucose 4-epimerase GalE [Bacillota bacterium]|jgi:UDP-glucose 4-epimerase|nr:UDP-glucose 4-epimerase GalE [Bacillota bacterium]HOF65681.1 UDP-glucose 4-epimerase GalE [Bacilli bacterium]HPK86353.1 UDP-glucose 4-epimerase GalE [Bacilli bacterium]
MKILVTGGTGYIGSHTVVELLNRGHEVLIVDNLINSKIEVLNHIKTLTHKTPIFYKVDCTCKKELRKVFLENDFEAVIHFAGLKAVGESVEKPIEYYFDNLVSTLNVLQLMHDFKVRNIVFSSSATVYGTPKEVPLKESFPRGETTNPYGTSKAMIEQIIEDFIIANPTFKAVILRYFNPIGAHPSGLIGEEPDGIPNNLMPYISRVATGEYPVLNVFGNDYDTPDGTGIRDYIHVVDLAIGHILSLENIDKLDNYSIFNLGTGKGTSVLELVNAYEEANSVAVPFVIKERRAGDVAVNYADVSKAESILGFKAKFSIKDACRESYNFEKNKKK